MRFSLLDFQQEYVADLLTKLRRAKRGIVEDRELQAVLLAAPTGSGKTVMLAATIEQVLFGADGFTPEPDAVFLWISDQPELNEQSRARLLAATSLLREYHLITVQPEFDRERFESGKVYFLNTQKLGKDKTLTTKGDRRTFTIWETVQNTAEALRDRFYVVIDEAHRGMSRVNKTEAEIRTTTVQKFLLGNPAVAMQAVPLVLGISATPQRFRDLLSQAHNDRNLREVVVDPAKVRESGLLKEQLRVFIPPADNKHTDWTLLRGAAQQWVKLRDEWRSYCESQGIPMVEPVLVVQVEDGSGKTLTKTSLATAVQTIEEAVGPVSNDALAHCFQEDNDLSVGTHKIRYLAPSKISADPAVKVVFFKMALTTGWDCPRAEVMMSFRKAVDATLIAQLVGRMVRTPLARRIEDNELLNEVHLYLPHYDEEGLKKVITQLSTDADNVPTTKVVLGSDVEELRIPEHLEPVMLKLRGLPSYTFPGGNKKPDSHLLFRLGSLLALHDVDKPAREEAVTTVVDTLTTQRDLLLANNATFQQQMQGIGTITLQPLRIDQLTYAVTEGAPETIEVASQNIEDLYAQVKRRLGPELAIPYVRKHYSEEDPDHAKLELYLLAQRRDVWNELEANSRQKFNELRKRNLAKIQGLESSKRQHYDALAARSKRPEVVSLEMPLAITLPKAKEGQLYSKHLFVNAQHEFKAVLNEWETKVLNSELIKDECIAWLRNIPRKPWALVYPYQQEGKYLPAYPDFLVVRDTGSGYLVDIIEPHRSTLTDAWEKARGLADFTEKHGGDFGRVLLLEVDGNHIRELDFQDIETREQALRLNGPSSLTDLYERHGKLREG